MAGKHKHGSRGPLSARGPGAAASLQQSHPARAPAKRSGRWRAVVVSCLENAPDLRCQLSTLAPSSQTRSVGLSRASRRPRPGVSCHSRQPDNLLLSLRSLPQPSRTLGTLVLSWCTAPLLSYLCSLARDAGYLAITALDARQGAVQFWRGECSSTPTARDTEHKAASFQKPFQAQPRQASGWTLQRAGAVRTPGSCIRQRFSFAGVTWQASGCVPS
jgi:hypothetical protein